MKNDKLINQINNFYLLSTATDLENEDSKLSKSDRLTAIRAKIKLLSGKKLTEDEEAILRKYILESPKIEPPVMSDKLRTRIHELKNIL